MELEGFARSGGAKLGGAESIMADSIAALAEVGLHQYVVTRPHDEEPLDLFRRLDVGYALSSFDKVLRASTDTTMARAIEEFLPDVCHYWMSRAATFAPRATHASISAGMAVMPSKVRIHSTTIFELGIQGFGDAGTDDNFGLADQAHYWGPFAQIEVGHFNNGELELQLGYLAGFREAEAGGIFRVKVEYEFGERDADD